MQKKKNIIINSFRIDFLDENNQVTEYHVSKYRIKPFCNKPENVFMAIGNDVRKSIYANKNSIVTIKTNKGEFKQLMIGKTKYNF